MNENMVTLGIMADWLTRAIVDLGTIRTAIIENDRVALFALLRYYRHIRDYSRYEPMEFKRGVAIRVCAIIETYLNERNETEV